VFSSPLTRGCLVLAIALSSLGLSSEGRADDRGVLRIAVAANFQGTLNRLVADFAQSEQFEVVVSTGASGLLYGQIVQGAPFDLFFSADADRPLALERDGLIVPGSRYTYAEGVLALWRPGAPAAGTVERLLTAPDVGVLAIANPQTAPYGAAAEQVLARFGLLNDPPFRIVRGESIGQAFQFVASGNATLGFVALAQLIEFDARNGRDSLSEGVIVDPMLYEPIVQQAVWLSRARGNPLAPAFLEFVRSPAGRALVRAAGYALPDETPGERRP
jgi:molybdate transport system substrate-binding protein